jgi:hypothetical protein
MRTIAADRKSFSRGTGGSLVAASALAGGLSARRVAMSFALLMLAACADELRQSPAWSLEGRPGLLLAINQYYQGNASEDRGRCRAVLMDGVTGSELVSEKQDRVVVNVRYRYRTTSRSERGRGCGGFGERTFEVIKSGALWRVVSMSGDRDDGGLRWRLW